MPELFHYIGIWREWQDIFRHLSAKAQKTRLNLSAYGAYIPIRHGITLVNMSAHIALKQRCFQLSIVPILAVEHSGDVLCDRAVKLILLHQFTQDRGRRPSWDE